MFSKTQAKYIQSLHHKKFRDLEDAFIAEGEKVVIDLLQSHSLQCLQIWAVKEWWQQQETTVRKHFKGPIGEVLPHELEKISALQTPNKVLAVFKKRLAQDPAVHGNLILALDAIRDPGNMGTIIRIADWFGVSSIVCSQDSADIYNPKVVQSTMGSLGRVNVYFTHLAQWLQQQATPIFATTLQGDPLSGLKGIKEGIVVIGNEANGISDAVLACCNRSITIPRIGLAESLNAAVATGIVLSHV